MPRVVLSPPSRRPPRPGSRDRQRGRRSSCSTASGTHLRCAIVADRQLGSPTETGQRSHRSRTVWVGGGQGLVSHLHRVHPHGMSRWTTAVEAAHVVTLGALVGIVAVDPTARVREATDWDGWLYGHMRVDRVMSRVAPPLFLSATTAAAGASLVARARHQGRAAAGRAAAAGCVAAAIAVTLVVNEPLNERIRGWRSQDPAPGDWREVRGRWERGHRFRRALIATGAVATVWGGTGLGDARPMARRPPRPLH